MARGKETNWDQRQIALVKHMFEMTAGGIAISGLGIAVANAAKRVRFEQSLAQFETAVNLLNSPEAQEYNAAISKITAASVVHYKGATLAVIRSTVGERLFKPGFRGLHTSYGTVLRQLLKQEILEEVGSDRKGNGIVRPAAALAGTLLECPESLPTLTAQIRQYGPDFDMRNLIDLVPEPDALEFNDTLDGV